MLPAGLETLIFHRYSRTAGGGNRAEVILLAKEKLTLSMTTTAAGSTEKNS